MAALCLTDSFAGTITRYEIGGESWRKTHVGCFGKSVSFTKEFIERFRVDPPEDCRVEPPTPPTGPRCDSGELPCDVEAQAA